MEKTIYPEVLITDNKINKKMLYSFSMEIIFYLNSITKSKFSYNNLQTIALIEKCFQQGFTELDFYKVVDIKCNEWLGTDFEKYLRPCTLFGPNFDYYVNQKEKTQKTIDDRW